MSIVVDEQIINEILSRGVEAVFPNKDFLAKLLASGRKIRLYYGVDPTGTTLHLGHLVQLLKLRKFQDLGHEVIILIGDFTAQIGDPTGKSATRKPLTHEQALSNAEGYKKQMSKVLDLQKADLRFVYNEQWSNKLKPADMLELASHFTVSQLLSRDMFQERIKAGREICVHEFLYPIFQAYDAVTMDVDLQIGGNDQMFNMLAGRDLMKKKSHKEMAVLTTKLLVDSDGKKMGKSEGNMVTLVDAPEEMYGKIMSWKDGLIAPAFEILTKISDTELSEIKDSLGSGQANPRDLKMRLGREIIKICHGAEAAEAAEKNFIATFQNKELPEDLPELAVAAGEMLGDILVREQTLKSKSEWRRLVAEGAIYMGGEERISDPNFIVAAGTIFKIGKRKFVKIITK